MSLYIFENRFKRLKSIALAALLASAPFGMSEAEAAQCLQWQVEPESGTLKVQRVECETVWQGKTLGEITYWDASGAEHSQALTPANSWKIERESRGADSHLTCRQAELGFALKLIFSVSDDVLAASVPADGISESGEARLKTLRLLPRFGAAHEGDDGYLIIAQQSGALCNFRDKKPGEHRINVYQSICSCPMPLFGMVRGHDALAGIITSGQFDARICVTTNHGPLGQYAIGPSFNLRSNQKETRLPDDLTVEYSFLPATEATWLGVGKRYRQYNFERRDIRPLRERAAASPALAYSAKAIQVRIRLGVKPVPYEITMVNAEPGDTGYLRNIEYGGSTLAYFYGHFLLDESKNWLGERDYRYDNPEGLKQTVTKLRAVYDDFEKLQHLQMEFIEGHRRITEGVFETTYGNGQRLIVNYGEKPHSLATGQTVSPQGFRLVRD